MKKIIPLLLLLCLFSAPSFAQYTSVRIANNTPCPVVVLLYGTQPLSGCMADYGSSYVYVSAMSTLTIAHPGVSPSPLAGPGGILGPAGKFTMVAVLGTDPGVGCPPTTTSPASMSDCISGATTSVTAFDIEDYTSCSYCGTYDVDWTVINPTLAEVNIH